MSMGESAFSSVIRYVWCGEGSAMLASFMDGDLLVAMLAKPTCIALLDEQDECHSCEKQTA